MQTWPTPSAKPTSTIETIPSSRWCIIAESGMSYCIQSHELVSLILAIAVLIRALRGSR